MFKRKRFYKDDFSSDSGIKKWLFGASVFVIIALIWIGYFLFTQYLGKSDAIVFGLVYNHGNPVIDVGVAIGEEEVVTDENGSFSLSNISYGAQTIKISREEYIPFEKGFFIWKKRYDLGKIDIEKNTDVLSNFSGKVFDSFNSKPIKDAVVNFGTSNATTGNDGSFFFKDIEKGGHLLKISAIGYHDLEQVIDLDGTQGELKDFFLSPYGKISFTSGREGKLNIYSIGYDGKNLKNYTANVEGDCWGGTFTADGERLIFYSNVGDRLDQWGQKISNLYFLKTGSQEEKPINHPDVIPEDKYRVSQEGNRVLFLGTNPVNDKKELYIAGLGVAQEWIQLTDNDITESNFDISPNGKVVVFGAFEEGERKVFLMDIASREKKEIYLGQNREGSLIFSPDSESVLYTTEGYDLETKVFLYDMATGQSSQIYRNVAGIKNITWNKDGSRIAFIASRDDRNYIYSIDADGKNEVQILEQSGSYDELIWPPIEKIMIVKTQEGEGKIVSVIDLTQRKIHKVEDIFNDIIGWQKD